MCIGMRLKSFNKEKKLRQFKRRNVRNNAVKGRTLVLSFFVLILSVVYFTYARFDFTQDFEIVDAIVGDFSSDVILRYYMDDERVEELPAKANGVAFNKYSSRCKKADFEWNEENWELELSNITGKVICDLKFETVTSYKEDILGAAPELYDGLVPVAIDGDGSIYIQDPYMMWYSYENRYWANAVVLKDSAKSKTAGDQVTFNEIIQMYTWVPRFRYKLWNASNSSSDEQMIEVEFENKHEKKSSGSENGEWLTHPAFTFGNTELNGIWVGKFETGYDGATSNASANNNIIDSSKAIIKPNVYAWVGQDIGKMF